MKKLILCDKNNEDNFFDYKCPKLSSDDWDELADPCQDCIHKTYKWVEL